MAISAYAEHPAHQVFTICGHVVNKGAVSHMGYVIADTPQIAIERMQGYGFSVTAISSLAEVRETIAMMEMIANGNPEIASDEYLNLMEPNPNSPCLDANVFSFVGSKSNDDPRCMKMGFVIAQDAPSASAYLQARQFTTHSITSLADLRDVEQQLCQIAHGDPDVDDCSYINLKFAS